MEMRIHHARLLFKPRLESPPPTSLRSAYAVRGLEDGLLTAKTAAGVMDAEAPPVRGPAPTSGIIRCKCGSETQAQYGVPNGSERSLVRPSKSV